MQSPRLPELSEATLTPAQRALADSIKSGPRGQFKMSGPFAIYLHSPDFGELAQKLGGHLRFKTSVPPRLSEFAILCTGAHWKAQYEWAMHAPMAEKQGVKPETIRAIQSRPGAENRRRRTRSRSMTSSKSFMQAARQHRHLRPGEENSRRCRDGRAGRHLGCRHGVDDAQHLRSRCRKD